MIRTLISNPVSLLGWAAGLLVLKVTAAVVWGYRDYFPPNFSADFLQGRASYFHGAYATAFYAHILAGPCTLVLGLLLISSPFRQRFPLWHRRLGKAEVLLVLLVLAPSGLWMARYAATGALAGLAFAAQSFAVAACVLMGWRLAVQQRYGEHRRWMWRAFLILCSAVTLRLIGGLATVAEVGSPWSYPLAAWASWLVPLAVFELVERGTFLRLRASAVRSALSHRRDAETLRKVPAP